MLNLKALALHCLILCVCLEIQRLSPRLPVGQATGPDSREVGLRGLPRVLQAYVSLLVAWPLQLLLQFPVLETPELTMNFLG